MYKWVKVTTNKSKKIKDKISILNIGGFNCQGIVNKIEDPTFIEELGKFDILGVNETWLNTSNEKIFIPNYKFYPLSRKNDNNQTRGGGCRMVCKGVY